MSTSLSLLRTGLVLSTLGALASHDNHPSDLAAAAEAAPVLVSALVERHGEERAALILAAALPRIASSSAINGSSARFHAVAKPANDGKVAPLPNDYDWLIAWAEAQLALVLPPEATIASPASFPSPVA